MSDLYNVAGSVTYTALLSDPVGAQKIAVPLTPNKGAVPRGALLVRAAAGTWEYATATDIDGTKELAVLNKAVNTSDNTTVAEDADAFIAGRFVSGGVTLKTGSFDAGKLLILREQGIIIDNAAI